MEKELEIFVEAAEQLQALKATLAEQQGSSVRLRALTETLEQVSNQIAKIPSGLSGIVAKAEAIEKRVLAAAAKVEALKDEIPAVVARIENSDVGMSIDALTRDIAGSRHDLKVFSASVSKVDAVVQQFRQANDGVFNELAVEFQRNRADQERMNARLEALRIDLLAKLDQLEESVARAEEWSEKNTGATGKAFDVLATALKGSGDRQGAALQGIHSQIESIKSQELAAIRQELKAISTLVQKQGVALEAVAKKKGFSF